MIHFICISKSNDCHDERGRFCSLMSGHDYASNEEVERKERFYYVSPQGKVSFLGKQPDATLRGRDLIVAVKEGKMRIVNSKGIGKDAETLKKIKHLVKEQ